MALAYSEGALYGNIILKKGVLPAEDWFDDCCPGCVGVCYDLCMMITVTCIHYNIELLRADTWVAPTKESQRVALNFLNQLEIKQL